MVTSEMNQEDISRFWRKVDRSGGTNACWTWLAYKNRYGYGQIRIKRFIRKALYKQGVDNV